jgi:hypothetical protein
VHVAKQENAIWLDFHVMREKQFLLLKNALKREEYTLLWTKFKARCALTCGWREYNG